VEPRGYEVDCNEATASRKSENRRMSRRKNHEFVLLCVFSLLFWWSPIVTTCRLAWNNEAYTHIILILPLSAALIYLDSKTGNPKTNSQTLRPALEPGRLGGSFLLAAILVFASFVRWGAGLEPDVRLSLSMLALVVWWIASIVCCFGFSVLRSLLFPICFLFWIVPLPDFLLNAIVQGLQSTSAVAARWLFQFARVPVTQDGILLSIPGLDIEVARECSSIRSSLILIVTTMVLAHLFLRSWWRRLVLLLIAIPLSAAKNGLRIFVIAELAMRVDRGYLDGSLHHHGGIVFLMIAMAGIATLLWILHRTEAVRNNSQFSTLRS